MRTVVTRYSQTVHLITIKANTIFTEAETL